MDEGSREKLADQISDKIEDVLEKHDVIDRDIDDNGIDDMAEEGIEDRLNPKQKIAFKKRKTLREFVGLIGYVIAGCIVAITVKMGWF